MLEALRRVVQEVSTAPDLTAALEVTVDRVRSIMTTEVCSVYLLDDKQNRYVFRATRGLNQSVVGKVSLGIGEGLVGYVAERAEPLNVEAVTQHPRNQYIAEIGEDEFNAFLGVPIIHQGQTLGVLVVQQRDKRRFDESEEAFLVTLSAQLAGLIAHAKVTGLLAVSRRKSSRTFTGAPGAPGVALGVAIVIYPSVDLSQVPYRKVRNVAREVDRFTKAVAETRTEVEGIAKKMANDLREDTLGLFDAYLMMLDEGAIPKEVVQGIKKGQWAQGALKQTIETHLARFDLMEDAYLRERSNDLRELGNRMLSHLEKRNRRRLHFPKDTILVGDDLSLSDLAAVPRERLKGIVSGRGSVNSHLAILAEALGVPTVMGVQDLPMPLIDGGDIIVDGFQGVIVTAPTNTQRQQYRKRAEEEAELTRDLEGLAAAPCITPDGHRTRLWVNTGLFSDVARSLERGAEGVGLYRTEIHYMMSEAFPTEEEQRQIYRAHLLAFSPRPVTMRTLDIGGDKALPYFPIQEENPFLGWRGIRVSLDHPEIFIAQIRAMIRASEGIDCYLRIMLPMVSSIAEVDMARQLIDQCVREVEEEGVVFRRPDIGVMIEVPAAVYQADALLKRVDFLSVGSNDLVQYMLAVDRNNAQVAGLYQEFHPAVLKALKQVADAAIKAGKGVGICGEMAGNPGAALLLMAMGYQVLSMNSPNLLLVKKVLTSLTLTAAKALLDEVLQLETAQEVKRRTDETLTEAGLGQLIRVRR
ncbi:phosphoenolpyruvate--protein phosphotransferase [Pseudomonadales bacterium]|nr:phosphoenolpyruvate--protein phosphotransferase [Pseudomonadales bacterium]